MPDAGGDPQQSGSLLDYTGGGSDPSSYYALSPGGRFPGDIKNFLEYLSAQNTGGQLGNGSEDKSNVSLGSSGYGKLISALVNGLVNNARQGGAGQELTNPLTNGGYDYQASSGPGAAYGPPGGSLNGLVDIGNPTPADGVDKPTQDPGVGGTPTGAPKKHGGGGGSGGGSFSFTPVQSNIFTPSFVGYSPTQPGAVQHAASFVGGSGAPLGSFPSPGNPSSAPGAVGGPVKKPSGGGTGGGKGKQLAGVQYGGTAPAVPAGGERRPDGRIIDAKGRTIYIPGAGDKGGTSPGGGVNPNNPSGTGPAGTPPPGGPLINLILGGGGGAVVPSDRDPHGINFNNVDKSTPNWVGDPTQGIQNTGGFPRSTLPDPQGMSQADYIGLLHDSGYTNEEIANIVGSYGFHIGNPQQGPPGPDGLPGGDNVTYGWGTGPVVRGDNGYHFANQGLGGAGGHPGMQSETPNSTLSSGTGYFAR